MKKLVFLLVVFFNTTVYAQKQEINWQEITPGIWEAVIGNPEEIDLLRIAEIQPRTDALQKLGKLPFPDFLKTSSADINDNKTYLRFPLQKEEQLFGLGLNFKTVQQRGTIKNLHVDHYNGQDDGRTHAPIPFYVSDKGYGILINSARYLTVYAGTSVRADSKDFPSERNRNDPKAGWEAQPYSDAVEILVPAIGVKVYVFVGKTPLEVVQRYNLFNGGGTLPPKWGLGFTHRTPTLFTDKQVLKEVAAFETKGYPLSFVGLEPGWQSTSYPNSFVWDKTRFPQPQQFLSELRKKNIRVNLWINPYTGSKSPVYDQIRPYTSSHTVWMGLVPDFTLKPAQELYKKLFTSEHLKMGVSGYKVDEVDGYDNWLWPDVATFPSGIPAEQMRQVYGLKFQKMVDSWFRGRNTRTYGLVRASNAGASNLPFVIYNDYYDHRDFITALCNSSFLGVLWTPEARSSKTDEEWLRRMQTVCFSPMAMLNAWADGTKPWTYPAVAEPIKQVMLLRMQLLPYLYTTFAQYHFEGKPPVRAMNLVEGFSFTTKSETVGLNSTDNPYGLALKQDIKDQYMLGDYLLVAPLFAGEKSRKVILPAGKWYDFYTGKLAGAGEVFQITPGMDKIPLFVKDGGIIPLIPPCLKSPANETILPLTVRHYGEKEGSWNLYDDDGETFNYEKGAYTWTRLEVKKDKNGLLKGNALIAKKNNFHYKNIRWEFMTTSK
ncbi:TIM-barrel domain-containing protein [Adhaeribacter radiodurans]|uniref:DUF5110 domain-containing protein n=1 Tax=Adhaeribacter radiodurans TaxID=2745197 RepID=A0A7L7L5Z3_9BACT|nr:TIM-barrel domain-containing protein [Adhaeribacter radiodurans]QMU28241.1 DUF5110 domain-containing protein [Adhaeribacter radiodurans]